VRSSILLNQPFGFLSKKKSTHCFTFGNSVTLLGPAPSAQLPSFLLWICTQARDFDTKHITTLGLLAERYGARLSVKDRQDFIDKVNAWVETKVDSCFFLCAKKNDKQPNSTPCAFFCSQNMKWESSRSSRF